MRLRGEDADGASRLGILGMMPGIEPRQSTRRLADGNMMVEDQTPLSGHEEAEEEGPRDPAPGGLHDVIIDE